MKNKASIAFLCALAIIIGGLFSPSRNIESATITKGYTFSTNELLTAAKLHTLVDSATLSSIVSADITDGTIVAADLAANSVTTDKILDATILGTDVASRTLTSGLYSTGSVDGIALSTSLTLRNGTALTFTNGTFALSGATLTMSDNQLPENALPSTVITNRSSVIESNLNTATGSATAGNWLSIANVTTTFTTGSVVVVAKAATAGTALIGVRIREANNTGSAFQFATGSGSGRGASVSLADNLTGTAKTYHLEVTSDGSSTVYTNIFTHGSLNAAVVSNMLGIAVQQTP